MHNLWKIYIYFLQSTFLRFCFLTQVSLNFTICILRQLQLLFKYIFLSYFRFLNADVRDCKAASPLSIHSSVSTNVMLLLSSLKAVLSFFRNVFKTSTFWTLCYHINIQIIYMRQWFMISSFKRWYVSKTKDVGCIIFVLDA